MSSELNCEIGLQVIPEGSAVMIPTWYIHHDPNTWPDPWKFDPERFSPENRYLCILFFHTFSNMNN